MTRRALPVLLMVVVVLTGCGLRDPYTQQAQKGATARGEAAQMSLPAGTLDHANSATSVLARYATAWVNWSAATLPRERAGLSTLATGRLADELRRDAAQAVKNRLQEVSNAYSRGRYVGLIRGADGGAIVVTYEEVAPVGGSPQGAYHVYLVRTERAAHGWRVSEWQPATDS